MSLAAFLGAWLSPSCTGRGELCGGCRHCRREVEQQINAPRGTYWALTLASEMA